MRKEQLDCNAVKDLPTMYCVTIPQAVNNCGDILAFKGTGKLFGS